MARYTSVSMHVFLHCVKSVRIWSSSGQYFPAFGMNIRIPYLSVFSLNAGKYGPGKPQIRTLILRC